MSESEELGYRVSYTTALQEVRLELKTANENINRMANDVRQALAENAELKSRVRALELRFYAILAGLLTAIAVLAYQGGGVQ